MEVVHIIFGTTESSNERVVAVAANRPAAIRWIEENKSIVREHLELEEEIKDFNFDATSPPEDLGPHWVGLENITVQE